ncbi:ribosome recycling factor [Candidatus Woesebacteria bacterium RIFCSPLOWO2_01_FULL_39_21]|uniref:Ribosome-recycling factor n=1 Tax=Candidatus Woesebacteria bacterium RIFCSPLOWO2_01_FULL_39_21 TaxID=1802519 RepID=A0A1F8BJE7_9BACT|nr:MAG: ribosome recycling factor [Candidatus Woesebacteria bacterium RIFCSPHIGHO2_01_FULL_39_23]OGM64194.1 MAG: ribosome recycling factor [Candidatus Woesebacteria bacterium RIFCSPLOWO2_01_FULL_39_21]
MDETSVTSKMQQVVDLAKNDISSVRTGRAQPNLVENIVVSAYGGTAKLKVLELASITAPDPQSLVIDPWDKSVIGEIKQAILSANIGLNPSLDGEKIRIVVPPMTFEDREKFVKLLSAKLESARVMIRQVRADMMHDIRKSFEAHEVSEDEKFSQEKNLQELTDKYISMVDEMGEKKKQELLSV